MLPRAPFIGFVLFYMTGILVADTLPAAIFASHFLLSGIGLGGLLLCLFLYRYNKKTAFGLSFSALLIFLACFSKILVNKKNISEVAELSNSTYTFYQATVHSLPEKRSKSVRLEVTVNRIWDESKAANVDFEALINISSDSDQLPMPGDWIVVKGNLERPMAATNPGQFDYQKYLENKGILWTDYLRTAAFQIIPAAIQPNGPRQWSLRISHWADQKFRENLTDDQSYGLVKAMLLGRRDDLRSEQVDNYIASGTVHILSVSGMHVAIIFLVISYLLGWMKRFTYGNALYLLTIISLLSFYAMVTGLPPSVQRATIMCIVFIFAEVFGKRNNAMNTLAISALLILLFDPAALYDVGFQLSYLAMTGIFLFYQPILAIFNPGNRITKFVWQISALSFAAQLATFPLSLYYFHQFPSYFLLVNPFVIAFTNVLLPAAIVLLAVSVTNFTWLQWVVNFVTDISAKLTDWSVTIPKHLPAYLIENLNIGFIEIIILNAIMLLVWYAYYSQEYGYLKYAFALVFLFASIGISSSTQTYLGFETIQFEVPKHSVRGFKRGNVLHLVSDRSFASDKFAYDFYIKNYEVEGEVEKVVFVNSIPK